MIIEHVAVWTKDLERLRAFYEKYFGATANPKYRNDAKQFESYFLSFQTGARLELMSSSNIQEMQSDQTMKFGGYTHLAISLGAREEVDALTSRLQRDGYQVLDGPRLTGDGYYESVILDPDGNRIELTI